MKKSTRSPVLVSSVVSFALVYGCHTTQDSSTVKHVGIVQIATHPLIDSVRTGFLKEMEELGYRTGANVLYDIQNAQGEMSTARVIAQKFVSRPVDLIFSIATPTTQAVANETRTIPIVFGAVTDPKSAGIVANYDAPEGNVTGVSDLFPIDKQLDLFKQILPNLKVLGVVYNPGESNSKAAIELTRAACQKRGITLLTAPVSGTADIRQAALSLAGRVDAFFNGGDNTIASGLESLVQVAEQARKPLLASDIGTVERGGLATYGTDYSNLGRECAKIADRILKGTPIRSIPVKFYDADTIALNVLAANKVGITFPPDLMTQAKRVIR